MTIEQIRKDLERLTGLLQAKAEAELQRSNSGYRAGVAEGLFWASRHLETYIKDLKPTT